MGLWSQEVMNKTLSSCTNQLCDLGSYLNSLGFNFLVYKAGHKVDCFMEQFGGCSRNVLLLLFLPFFPFSSSILPSDSTSFPHCTLVRFWGRIQKLDWGSTEPSLQMGQAGGYCSEPGKG